MTPLPNPFILEPFIIDEDRFLADVWGFHELPPVEPLPLEAFEELLKAS